MDAALAELNSVSALVTASEWRRAAIVWAFTTDKQGQRTSHTSVQSLGVAEFAALGISGLQSRNTVAKYRRAWAKAIEAGHAFDVQPGDDVVLPGVDWRTYFNPPNPRRNRSTKPRWDGKVDGSARLGRMADQLRGLIDGLDSHGLEGEMLQRVANSVFALPIQDNRAMSQVLHSLIEFTSAYKEARRRRNMAAA